MTHREFRWAVAATVCLATACDPRTDLTETPPTLALSSTSLNPVGTIGGPVITQTVTIVNGTDGTLENLAVAVNYQGGTTGWLAATLDRTTATREQPATLQVRSTPGSLGLGAYLATINVTAADAANGPIAIAVRFTVDPRPPTKLAIITQPSGSSVNGQPFAQQPVVQLLNELDQPATKAGVTVTAAIASGGGVLSGATSVVTDAAGRAAFTNLAITGAVGARALTFGAANLTSAVSATTTLTPGAAQRLEAASPTTQTINAGTAAAAPIARVVDQSGNGVSGIMVAFTVSVGGIIAPPGPLPTNATGLAGPNSWTLSQVAGPNSVTASVNGLQGSPLTFSATGQPGPATQLIKQSGDNLIGLVGTTLSTPHVVKVADQFGNGVSGVSIGWSVGGGGSTSPTTGTTDGSGIAQSTRTLPPAAGPVTTTASATLSGNPVTAVFAVTAANAGPAQIVKTGGDNQNGVVATTLATPIRVQVLDAIGTPQPNVTVTFSTPNGGTFPGGATIATDANGFAQTTWQLGPLAGSQTAQAAVGGPPPAIFAATATPGPLNLAQSSIAASPSSITAGGGGSTVTVTARDAFGNRISGLAVVLANVGAGTLTQPAGPTNAQGQASGSFAATIAGNKTISATIAGQSLPQTATVTVTAGAPAIVIAITPTTGFALRFGQAVAAVPAVQVQDTFGNGVSGVGVTFAVSLGQSTPTPGATTTNSAGVAAMSSWLIGPFTGAGSPQNVYNQITALANFPGANSVVFTGVATVSFGADLYPFFQGSCTGGGCHSLNNPILNQAAATVYTTLLNPNQRYVIPSDTTNADVTRNLLYRKPAIDGVASHTGGQFPAAVVTVIKAWIRQGAPNN